MRDVNVGHKFLADYQSIILKELLAEIRELAAPLQGRRVLHVNATSFGGGVAEILYTLLPLMNDVGLRAEWQVMTADNEFFNVTKSFHNGLQGAAVELTDEVRALYEDVNRRNAAQLTRHYDFVVVHDPQPCALRAWAAADGAGEHALDLALPHRHLDARPDALRLPAAVHPPLRPGDLHDGRLRSRRPGHSARGRASGHRPAGPQEHDAGARRRPLHRAPVRHRRGPSAAAAGLALRSVEGPAGRGRRLPAGQGAAGPTCSSR